MKKILISYIDELLLETALDCYLEKNASLTKNLSKDIPFEDQYIVLNEIELTNLKKLVSHHTSETQQSCLMLARELYTLPYSNKLIERFALYLKSPYDTHFTLIKQFHSLEKFRLWYISKHPYKEFTLFNYTEVL